MTREQEQLITIFRSVVLGHALPEGFALLDPAQMYKLSKKQDLAHFVGYCIDRKRIVLEDEEIRKNFRNQYMQAARRVMILENEIRNIKAAFEEVGIDFLPLKGAILRGLYPAPWMRVSGDIDMLVHGDELAQAEQVLIEKLRYTVTREDAHHDHVTAPTGFHVDLHFQLTEREEPAKPLLDGVWDRCARVAGKEHEYRMDDDMFYLFHVFHAAAHFQMGGCGVRTVLDTWLLNHRLEADKEKRRDLLRQARLLPFAEALEAVAEAWFSGVEDDRFRDMEEYIFTGGLFGGSQRIAAAQARHGNRLSYLIHRAFPPISVMRYVGYPVVVKWPMLLPACWVHRLVRGLVQGKGKLIPFELRKTKKETERSEQIAILFRRLGLK